MRFLYFYKNKNLLTFLLLLFISFGLMFFNVKVSLLNLRPVLLFIIYPFQIAVSSTADFFSKTFASIKRINELEKELDFMRKRLINYQETLLMFNQMMEENKELKKALNIKGSLSFDSIYARVLFRDPTFLNQTLIINRGIRDGVKVNMPVVSYNEEGEIFLVGKIHEVSLFSSKVEIINSSEFYLGVTFAHSPYIGILKGSGSYYQNSVVDYIPVEADIKIGDEVVTSGESEIFPPHLKVGKVVAVTSSIKDKFFKKVYVKTILNYLTVRDLFVLNWQSTNLEVKEEGYK